MHRLTQLLLAGVAVIPGMAFAGSGDLVAYRARATYRTGASPGSMMIADVNRDGKPDLVVGNAGDGSASVLYGRGDGYFLTRTNYDTGGVANLFVADINLDGKPDILAAGYDELSFLGGNGGGTFKTPRVLDWSVQYGGSTDAFALADFNRDGRADFVKGFPEYGFYISLGDGRGNFGALTHIGQNGFSFAAFAADLNRDGNPDLVTTNLTQDEDSNFVNGLSMVIGRGDGTFTFGQYIELGKYAATAIKVADVNFDAKPDLIYTLPDGTAQVSLGHGDGTFGKPTSFQTGAGPSAMVVADMNRDGKPDLVITNYGDNTVSVLRGNGDGTFAARQDFPTGHGPSALAVADVNRDGIPDIVVTDSADNTVSVLLGTAP